MSALSVYVRVDASSRTGGGHLSRCLALVDEFADAATRVVFVGADLDAPYARLISERGHTLARIPRADGPSADRGATFDWEVDAAGTREILAADEGREKALVVDHYRIDRSWESAIRPAAGCLMVIDDLADRPHDCDVLLDQAYGQSLSRYEGLVGQDCKLLLGPDFALLRPSFHRVRGRRPGFDKVRKDYVIHVFFGSEDRDGNTLRYSALLLGLDKVGAVKAAVSAQYPHPEALAALQADHPGRFSWEVPGERMAEHMGACDIAVGAPGQATWERACLGLPAAYVATSSTQVEILHRLQADGFCRFFGTAGALQDREFCEKMQAMLDDGAGLLRLARVSRDAVDGLGAGRAASEIRRVAGAGA